MLFVHAARTMFWRLVPLQTCLDWSYKLFPDLTVGDHKRRPMRRRDLRLLWMRIWTRRVELISVCRRLAAVRTADTAAKRSEERAPATAASHHTHRPGPGGIGPRIGDELIFPDRITSECFHSRTNYFTKASLAASPVSRTCWSRPEGFKTAASALRSRRCRRQRLRSRPASPAICRARGA